MPATSNDLSRVQSGDPISWLSNRSYAYKMRKRAGTFIATKQSGIESSRIPKACYSYSRVQRFDCKQVVIALVITPEGFPVAYLLNVLPHAVHQQMARA
jgi:hypothetical protein